MENNLCKYVCCLSYTLWEVMKKVGLSVPLIKHNMKSPQQYMKIGGSHHAAATLHPGQISYQPDRRLSGHLT
jgi:hypothetical protein